MKWPWKHPIWGYTDTFNLRITFEMPSFAHSKDMMEGPKCKSWGWFGMVGLTLVSPINRVHMISYLPFIETVSALYCFRDIVFELFVKSHKIFYITFGGAVWCDLMKFRWYLWQLKSGFLRLQRRFCVMVYLAILMVHSLMTERQTWGHCIHLTSIASCSRNLKWSHISTDTERHAGRWQHELK